VKQTSDSLNNKIFFDTPHTRKTGNDTLNKQQQVDDELLFPSEQKEETKKEQTKKEDPKNKIYATLSCCFWEAEKPIPGFLQVAFQDGIFCTKNETSNENEAQLVPLFRFAWKDVQSIEKKKRLLKKVIVYELKDKKKSYSFSSFDSFKEALTESMIIFKAWNRDIK
jgi:NADH dehydrogenase FAD-containing subunit